MWQDASTMAQEVRWVLVWRFFCPHNQKSWKNRQSGGWCGGSGSNWMGESKRDSEGRRSPPHLPHQPLYCLLLQLRITNNLRKIHQKCMKNPPKIHQKWWAWPGKTLGQMLSQMKANEWAALHAIDAGFLQLICHESQRHFKAFITAAVSLSKRHQKNIKR